MAITNAQQARQLYIKGGQVFSDGRRGFGGGGLTSWSMIGCTFWIASTRTCCIPAAVKSSYEIKSILIAALNAELSIESHKYGFKKSSLRIINHYVFNSHEWRGLKL